MHRKKSQRSREALAYLCLQRTADSLARGFAELFKTADLSATQYNVLRILRGAGESGVSCREVGERMITRDPDITRLLDRLARRGLIERARAASDRRVVQVTITAAGLALLASLEAPVEELHTRQLGHLGAENLETLMRLLEEARRGAEGLTGSADPVGH